MYAGEIVEKSPTEQLFSDPRHPYTIGLMESVPDIDAHVERLQVLEGLVPSLYDMPEGCRFGPRCQYFCEECAAGPVPLVQMCIRDSCTATTRVFCSSRSPLAAGCWPTWWTPSWQGDAGAARRKRRSEHDEK